MRTLLTQLTRFGLVGLIGLVVDVAVFNLLSVTLLSPDVLHEGPVVAKVIATSLAIIANWLGNRHWTFRRETRRHPMREGLEFAIVSIGGMLIGLACLWVSRYALGFESLLADNISSFLVGLPLGTAFRFWGYRVWVFREPDLDTVSAGPASRVDPASGVGPTSRAGATTSTADALLRPTEGPVVPAGSAPLHRIQAVAAVDDRRVSDQ